MSINYEKLWQEIEEIAKEEFLSPPVYAKNIQELKEEFGLTQRHEIRNFLNRMIKEKKLKLWGRYRNRNYYVPFTSDVA